MYIFNLKLSVKISKGYFFWNWEAVPNVLSDGLSLDFELSKRVLRRVISELR